MEAEILRKLQMTELEILSKVADICDENDIPYYLLGGTLLGAIRHKGFIPWDDDLDIGIPREDYKRFISLCTEHGVLGDDYYLHHISTDKEYWLPFSKVRKKNTVFAEESLKHLDDSKKGIFIDVFPLDFIDVDKGFAYSAKAKLLKFMHHFALMRRTKNPEKTTLRKIIKFLTGVMPTQCVFKLWDKIAENRKGEKFVINYGSNYSVQKQTMPREIYEPAVKVEFEGKMFSAPAKSEEYLVHLFGNWQKLPPEEERINHNPSKIIF